MDAALLGPSGRTVLKFPVVSIGYSSDNQLVVNDANNGLRVVSHDLSMQVTLSASVTQRSSIP